MGVPGMMCTTCHGPENVDGRRPGGDAQSIPGNPDWHLAPIEMAWVGKSLGEICAQIKDPARNGGKTLDEIVEHMAHDELVGWGWEPGDGREPVPGHAGGVRRADQGLGGYRRPLPGVTPSRAGRAEHRVGLPVRHWPAPPAGRRHQASIGCAHLAAISR